MVEANKVAIVGSQVERAQPLYVAGGIMIGEYYHLMFHLCLFEEGKLTKLAVCESSVNYTHST
jgi:hypothetical protein